MIFEFGSHGTARQPLPQPRWIPVGPQRYDLMTDSNGNLYLQEAGEWQQHPDPRAKRWQPIGPVAL